MKARKYRFESEAIAAPLIAELSETDMYVVINNNEEFAMIPVQNPNFNPELPINADTNYPLMQIPINESLYCIDVLWTNEPNENWTPYEIKVAVNDFMIHKFDKFNLSSEQLIPVINEYLSSFNKFKFNAAQTMTNFERDSVWETGVVDDISSIHNNSQAVVGDNSYKISIAVFDESEKVINFKCLLASSNAADRFVLIKYNSYYDFSKKENGINIFTLSPSEEVSSSVTVQNLNILEFRYIKAEGGEATDKAHIKSVVFA